MREPTKRQNDRAWEILFAQYDILSHISTDGHFIISAPQIKEYREPRLMVKFDHKINLPRIFAENNLSILPISRKDYIISHFEVYHPLKGLEQSITHASLPTNMQSLDGSNIPSEAIAINCALASGILADFLEEETLYASVSGRMGSGLFHFEIQNTHTKNPSAVSVQHAQIEIDAAFEGIRSLALLEAKRDLSEDFLVRQLYYPYRVWRARVTKKVRPIFFTYSNGIFSLYEYEFQNPAFYNSLTLIKQHNYSIEDTVITLSDLQELAAHTQVLAEPQIAFPQADRFDRVINICELLSVQKLSREQITEEYAFDIRQTNYYTDAARYLGLVEKTYDSVHRPIYSLSARGEKIMRLSYKQRQLAFCATILEHHALRETFHLWLARGIMPTADEIAAIMQHARLYHVESMSTYRRRASTVSSWVRWMLALVNE